MNILGHKRTVLTALLCAAVLTSCQRATPPHAESAESAGSATPAPPSETAVKEPESSTRVVVGTYIDPSTMIVGGSNRLANTDRLFAGVTFNPVAGGTVVTARVNDASGNEVSKKEITVSDISQTSINFDLGVPAEMGLKPGSYSITADVAGRPGTTATVDIE